MKDWWVTVLVECDRSKDVRVHARSAWAAGWLHRQLNPGAEILLVRPVVKPDFEL